MQKHAMRKIGLTSFLAIASFVKPLKQSTDTEIKKLYSSYYNSIY